MASAVTGSDQEPPFDNERQLDVERQENSTSPPNNELLSELAHDYSKYLNIDIKQERAQLEDGIEVMLMKLDEYCALVDLVRSDTTQCLERTLPAIQEKTAEIYKVFERIDQLEVFVQMVSTTMDKMEKQVEEAESQTSSLKSIKKMFSSIPVPSFLSGKKSSSSSTQDNIKPSFNPPVIFKTHELLEYEPMPDSGEDNDSDFDIDTFQLPKSDETMPFKQSAGPPVKEEETNFPKRARDNNNLLV